MGVGCYIIGPVKDPMRGVPHPAFIEVMKHFALRVNLPDGRHYRVGLCATGTCASLAHELLLSLGSEFAEAARAVEIALQSHIKSLQSPIKSLPGPR